MKKQDRKGSTNRRQLVVLPAVGSRVLTSRGAGTVMNRGFVTCEVRLDDGRTERFDACEMTPETT